MTGPAGPQRGSQRREPVALQCLQRLAPAPGIAILRRALQPVDQHQRIAVHRPGRQSGKGKGRRTAFGSGQRSQPAQQRRIRQHLPVAGGRRDRRPVALAPEPDAVDDRFTGAFAFGIDRLGKQQHLHFVQPAVPLHRLGATRQVAVDIVTDHRLQPGEAGAERRWPLDIPAIRRRGMKDQPVPDEETVQCRDQCIGLALLDMHDPAVSQHQCIAFRPQEHRIGPQPVPLPGVETVSQAADPRHRCLFEPEQAGGHLLECRCRARRQRRPRQQPAQCRQVEVAGDITDIVGRPRQPGQQQVQRHCCPYGWPLFMLGFGAMALKWNTMPNTTSGPAVRCQRMT